MTKIDHSLENIAFHLGKFEISIYSIISVVVIWLITRAIIWIIKKSIFHNKKLNKYDLSNSYALYQIIRYILWVIAVGLMLESIGIRVTALIVGSAALLVGVGMGLQQTFNDIVSGIIILIEGSTRVGDILEVDDDVITIQQIGIRTSKGLNRDDIVVIIPNSQITTNKVINWSHQSMKTRFRIDVGVAYRSNVDQVINILQESALEHPDITDKELIEARLISFGASSLDFQLLFYSQNVFRIERVKSDIRRIINRKFAEQKVVIPFQQVDIHFKNGIPEMKEKKEF